MIIQISLPVDSNSVTGVALLAATGSALRIILRATKGIKPLSPLRATSRAVDHSRAFVYLLGEMAAGAWARRNRWEECLQRARVER